MFQLFALGMSDSDGSWDFAMDRDYAMDRGVELAKGSPLQQEYRALLGASPKEVFDFISDFERIPEWMPFVKRVSVDNENADIPGQVGAVRVIESFGSTTVEKVVAFEPEHLLAYSATDESLRGLYHAHLSVISCELHELGGTNFTWLSYAKPGSFFVGSFGPLIFRSVLKKSVDNLKKKFSLAG